ncbi:MAG: ExeA family protein, partial [Fimbriiglobus sp.]
GARFKFPPGVVESIRGNRPAAGVAAASRRDAGMDHTHFGLSRPPFRPTPDVDLYFPAAGHESAVAAMTTAYDDGAGIALIDGEPGTGKTLATLRFLNTLPADAPRVFLPAPRFARPADLFQAILFDFGAQYQGLSEHELRLAVTEHLLRGLTAGVQTVVVIDEAQHLGPDLLEEIRLLGNLESRAAKAVFVVLAALPVLRSRLGRADLAGFAQRLAVRPRLEPLSAEESVGFLVHHIEACGGDAAELLTDEAAELLAAGANGVPRVLYQAAAAAFALAAVGGESTVDAEAAVEALAQLGLEVPTLADKPTADFGPVRRAA